MEPAKAICSDERTGVFVNDTSVTHNLGMIFIETPVFTKLIEQLLAHDTYVELQLSMLLKPADGGSATGPAATLRIIARRSGGA